MIDRYQVVRTDGNGVVRIEDLALDARSLDLQIESIPARELVGAGNVNAGGSGPTVVDSIVADAPGLVDDAPTRGDGPAEGFVVDRGVAGPGISVPGDAGGPGSDNFRLE